MLNHLIKKKIIRIVSNQQLRRFKREVVSSDFDLNFHKDFSKKLKKNEKNKKKNKYDIENEKWIVKNDNNSNNKE